MNENENIRTEIIEQIAEMSKLLGMIPDDDTTTVADPVTQHSIELPEWFHETRDSFFKIIDSDWKSLGYEFPVNSL